MYIIKLTPEKERKIVDKVVEYLKANGPGECIMQSDNAIISAPEVFAEIADDIVIEGEGMIFIDEMESLLWLDDVRNPDLYLHAPEFFGKKDHVFWVKNYNEFVHWIEENGLPKMISFDHDLGTGKSGYDCAKWLVEYCMNKRRRLPEFKSHSGNPIGKENILSLLNNYKKQNI